MKLRIFFAIAALSLTCSLFAQNEDNIVRVEMDSTLIGADIFDLLGNGASVIQSPSLRSAMRGYYYSNNSREVAGYRVRIFFDNSRNARNNANEVMAKFKDAYPDTPAYLDYQNPYFKVTVGNFRTKSDATVFMNALRKSFPNCFIVKESLRFPDL
ncbi:MAG: SPOR domain-containing protein [Bacteroidales bacterium]|nr:SPOR domain-containing protein [Bacteroidales bacterium]